MTNEEAIEIIKQDIPCEHDTDLIEALDVAIKALEQQPCEDMPCVTPEEMQKCKDIVKKYTSKQQPCDDAISRKAVDELSKELVHTTRDKADFLCNFWEGLQKLPPVTPQQKYGKWIRIDKDKCQCDQCEVISFIAMYPNGDASYCPNCGAKMESEEDACKDCYYNDGEVHAECVVCEKAESEDKE